MEVIHDKAIIGQGIKEIRRQPTPKQIAEHERIDKLIMGVGTKMSDGMVVTSHITFLLA
jgi:hypothetical protein